MPRTPDSFPGVREDEGLILSDDGYGIPQAEGGLRYSDGYFYAKDSYGVFNLRSGEGGVGDVPHAPNHIHGGSDEIDGDILDIDFDPTHYTPDTSPSEVTSSEELTAHLAGIDGYLHDLGTDKLDIDDHRTLRHLIHFVDEGPGDGFVSGATKQILPAGNPFPTQIVWKDSGGNNLVVKTITRNGNQTPATIEWKMYDSDGVSVLAIVTDTINYSGIFEISRTRSIS